MSFYHYTCEHGASAILRDGMLRPQRTPLPPVQFVLWLTDLEAPARKPLGLTSHTLDCDRTAHRFVVNEPVAVLPWVEARRQYFPRWWVEELESTDGAMPMHWYVTGVPQRFAAPKTAVSGREDER